MRFFVTPKGSGKASGMEFSGNHLMYDSKACRVNE